MFCVLYELKVKSGQEESFRAAWRTVTENMVQDYGSLGARLHSTEEGVWIAYAQWPDKESWQNGHIIIEEESKQMHVEKYLDEIPRVILKMTVVDDLLAALPDSFGLL